MVTLRGKRGRGDAVRGMNPTATVVSPLCGGRYDGAGYPVKTNVLGSERMSRAHSEALLDTFEFDSQVGISPPGMSAYLLFCQRLCCNCACPPRRVGGIVWTRHRCFGSARSAVTVGRMAFQYVGAP